MTTKIETGSLIPNTRLRYIEDIERVNPKRRMAKFSCECGTTIRADLNWVRFLNITSCGCYKTEQLIEKNTKHSNSVRGNKSGAYRSWQAMHQRVKVNPRYSHVEVCERWSGEEGYISFLEDMGERPVKFSIERKDNSKGYSPENCIWADAKTQAKNTSNAVLVEFNDIVNTIADWCLIRGISYSLVKQRRRRGMSLVEAIITPVDESKRGRKQRHVS